MAAEKTIDQVINNWAIITVDKFQEALVRMDVGEVDGTLMRSFKTEVQAKGGDAFAVIIRFLNYGRFVDMGVGRGQPLGFKNVQLIGGNRYGKTNNKRQPKKWYSKTKTREVAVLRFLMARNFSILAVKGLEAELKQIK